MNRNSLQKFLAAFSGGSRRQKMRLSKQITLRGKPGVAHTSINSVGSAIIEGELWKATSEMQIEKGTNIKVIGTDGVFVRVEPIQ